MQFAFVDDAKNKEQRTDNEIQCKINYAELGPEVSVSNCDLDGPYFAVQTGQVNRADNRSFVIAEGCYHNESDVMLFSRSMLLRNTNNSAQQLTLDQTRLYTYQPDDIGHNEIGEEPIFGTPGVLYEELNVPIERDPLSGASGANATEWRSQTVRSYDAWERYLWNAHKYGLDYLTYSAESMSASLVPVVKDLRAHYGHIRSDGKALQLYTGYAGEVEVKTTTATDDDRTTVKVPKYVWFVVTTKLSKWAVAYVVPNGVYGVEAELCANRCEGTAAHCCVVGELAKHVPVLREIFTEEFTLF